MHTVTMTGSGIVYASTWYHQLSVSNLYVLFFFFVIGCSFRRCNNYKKRRKIFVTDCVVYIHKKIVVYTIVPFYYSPSAIHICPKGFPNQWKVSIVTVRLHSQSIGKLCVIQTGYLDWRKCFILILFIFPWKGVRMMMSYILKYV